MLILYHMSKAGAEVTCFHAFSHFGTAKAALERGRSVAAMGVEPYFYEVEFTAKKPLRISDLYSTKRSSNYGLLTLVDHLHYDTGLLSARQRCAILEKPGAVGGSTIAGFTELGAIIRSQGHDSVVYRNRLEDVGADTYMNLDVSQVRIKNVMRPPVLQT